MSLQIDEQSHAAPTTGTRAVSETGADSVVEKLTKDTVFEILKNQRRRDALAYLKMHDGVAKLSDMAEYIAAKENGIEIAALSSSQRKRVYIGMYQCHLPKMATAGVIDFDKNRGDIELRSEADQLEVYLDAADDSVARSSSSTKRNLVLAGGLGAGVLASAAGIPGFVLVPDVAWALVSTSALVALTALEARQSGSTADATE